MSNLTRILAALGLLVFTAGPVSAAAADTTNAIAQGAPSTQSGTVTGQIKDSSGAPVANARVDLRGAQNYMITTDATGAFSFSNVTPGLYTLTATRPGYESATDSDFVVVAGANPPLVVTMSVATFGSLRTIASVRAVGRGTFNQGTAAVSSVTAQDFIDQGAPQVRDVLNELPGIQISYPTGTSNGAVPGAITFPNIRNGLSFETALLIDGHPLAVGAFGDYVTTFLSPYMFGNVEVVKGPGAMAPEVNNAVGGTINFRTKDPTRELTSSFLAGLNNRGGTFVNFGISDTIGRLGFVADLSSTDLPSALNNQHVITSNVNGGVVELPNGQYDILGFNDSKSTLPGTNASNYNQFNLVACCYTLSGDYNNQSELLKLRYKMSNATNVTVSYLGSQTQANQNGNTSQLVPSVFVPNAGYAGSMPYGQQILVANSYPGGSTEINNEPIFQGEISTTLGNDTLLARYFHAGIDRLIFEGGSGPNTFETLNLRLSGVDSQGGGAIFNDVTLPVRFYNFYRQSEIDKIAGSEFQYSHPYGTAGNSLTFDVNSSSSQTTAYTQQVTGPTGSYAPPYNTVTTNGNTGSGEIPSGSSEVLTTFMLRAINNWNPRLSTTATLYSNQYNFTYPIAFTSTPAVPYMNPDGSNVTFQSRHASHFDGRFGATYHVNQNVVIRGSLGSSIAPPYLNQLSRINGGPVYSNGAQVLTVSHNNPNLVPETGFGYDVGADARIKGQYYLSGDIYLTNIYNQFLTSVVDSGLQCTSAAFPGSGCPSANGPEIFYLTPANLGNARYEGIELSLRRIVDHGIGFTLAGSTQRGYAYNVSPNFYCNFAPTPAKPCIPANYNTNLGVIPNQNFIGGNTSLLAGSNGVSNQSVPYLQGNAEINYRTRSGIYASFGETLYGKNNSFNEPPFTVARASLRVPVGNGLSMQVSGNNIFNIYSGLYPIVGGGVPFTTVNGLIGATTGNVLGPAQYNFILTKTLAPRAEGTSTP